MVRVDIWSMKCAMLSTKMQAQLGPLWEPTFNMMKKSKEKLLREKVSSTRQRNLSSPSTGVCLWSKRMYEEVNDEVFARDRMWREDCQRWWDHHLLDFIQPLTLASSLPQLPTLLFLIPALTASISFPKSTNRTALVGPLFLPAPAPQNLSPNTSIPFYSPLVQNLWLTSETPRTPFNSSITFHF